MIELHTNLGSGEIYTSIVCNSYEVFGDDCVILKKERPTYEVFAEFKEEEVKEELITKDEKYWINNILNSILFRGCEFTNILINKIYKKDGSVDYVEVEFTSVITNNRIYINNFDYAFDGLTDCSKYKLNELGLEE